jgi:hypothetical protein
MKRTITIIAAVIVVLGIAAFVYFYFFANQDGLTAQNGITNPFPSSDAASPDGTSASNDTTEDAAGEAGVQVAPRLVRIAQGPVAKGAVALDASTSPIASLGASTPSTATSSVPAAQPSYTVEVRYIDRQSGNMYAYHASDRSSVRLTNHTAPGIQEASWLPDGSLAYLRFLSSDSTGEHIETYALPANGTPGYLLARDLSGVVAMGTTSIFTLMGSTAGSVGTIMKPDGSNSATIFSSPLGALHVTSAGLNFIGYTKPSHTLPGYAFSIDRTKGTFSTILGPLSGLAALPSPDGKTVMYSYMDNGVPALAFTDPKIHSENPLPLATMVEKCVWVDNGISAYCAVPTAIPSGVELPDAWYQGRTSFTDRIWRIDFVARVATLAVDLPQLTDTPIDAEDLALDYLGSTLVFRNKSDGSLWAYSL